MRKRSLAPVAVLGAAAIALIGVSPAMAATSTWISPTDSWWSTATWGGAVPAAGDDVVFAGGNRSTYNLGDVTFASLRFTNDHTVANGGGTITLTDGISVEAGAAAIELGLRTTGDQQWDVIGGATLTLPTQVTVDAASTLTLNVNGSLMSTGNLDGQSSACIVKKGVGTLTLGAGGGGVGACDGVTEGLRIEGGSVDILAGAALGGKSFNVVSGGALTGGDLGTPSQVRQLNLNGGVVTPGDQNGLGMGELQLWGTSTWNGGVYEVDWDPATGDSDLVHGDGQAITVNGTRLMPYVWGPDEPATQITFTVLSSSVGITGAFTSPAGDALADGAEFAVDGWLYRYGQTSTAVTLTWLGEAPEEQPNPETPANPTPPREVSTAAPGTALPLTAAAPAVAAYASRTRR